MLEYIPRQPQQKAQNSSYVHVNGLFAFSFNEHSLMVPEYSIKVEQTVKEKKAEQLFCELGPHILKRDLKSMVYVIKKL